MKRPLIYILSILLFCGIAISDFGTGFDYSVLSGSYVKNRMDRSGSTVTHHDSTVAAIIPVIKDGVHVGRINATWNTARTSSPASTRDSASTSGMAVGLIDSLSTHVYRFYRATFISASINSGDYKSLFNVAPGNYCRVDSVLFHVFTYSGIDSFYGTVPTLFPVLIEDTASVVVTPVFPILNCFKYRSVGWKVAGAVDSSAYDSVAIDTSAGVHELIFRSGAYTARFDSLMKRDQSVPHYFYTQIVGRNDYYNVEPTVHPTGSNIIWYEKLYAYYSESSAAIQPYYAVYWTELPIEE
jgi:hypothetical protein